MEEKKLSSSEKEIPAEEDIVTPPKEAKSGQSKTGLMILMLVIGLGVGFGIGMLIGYPVGKSKGGQETENQYKDVLSEVTPLIPGLIPENQEVTSVSGTVTSVSANELKFEGVMPTADILETEKVQQFTALVSGETKIYRLRLNEAALSETVNIETPPDPFIEEEVTINDLKEGDQVSVETGKDIRGKTSFAAKEIMVRE